MAKLILAYGRQERLDELQRLNPYRYDHEATPEYYETGSCGCPMCMRQQRIRELEGEDEVR